MILVRRPKDSQNDYVFIGIFPVVSAFKLSDLIDEFTDPSGTEFCVVRDFGFLMDSGKTSLFSEFEQWIKSDSESDAGEDIPELKIIESGDNSHEPFLNNRPWFSHNEALREDLSEYQMLDVDEWLTPVGAKIKKEMRKNSMPDDPEPAKFDLELLAGKALEMLLFKGEVNRIELGCSEDELTEAMKWIEDQGIEINSSVEPVH